MSKVISFNLSRASINKAIKDLEDYQRWLDGKMKELAKALAEYGCQIASVKFASAQYDGTNDVSCHVEDSGDTASLVVATGNATLFIEFGTGVVYAGSHPEASGLGMVRGGYEHGLGRLPGGWYYQGEPGTNGEEIADGAFKGYIHTYGNPANMPMYEAKREIEAHFEEIARKVFTS